MRIHRRQAADFQMRKPVELDPGRRRFPHPEQEPRAIGVEPPGDKRQRSNRLVVEPLSVVDDAEERTLFSRIRKQCECGETHKERVWSASCRQSEGRPERVSLRARQPINGAEEREEELMEAREPQLHLRFDAHNSGQAEVIRQLGRVLEQRSLPRADLSLQDQRSAHTGSNCFEQALNGLSMLATINQRKPSHWPSPRARSKRGYAVNPRGDTRRSYTLTSAPGGAGLAAVPAKRRGSSSPEYFGAPTSLPLDRSTERLGPR